MLKWKRAVTMTDLRCGHFRKRKILQATLTQPFQCMISLTNTTKNNLHAHTQGSSCQEQASKSVEGPRYLRGKLLDMLMSFRRHTSTMMSVGFDARRSLVPSTLGLTR